MITENDHRYFTRLQKMMDASTLDGLDPPSAESLSVMLSRLPTKSKIAAWIIAGSAIILITLAMLMYKMLTTPELHDLIPFVRLYDDGHAWLGALTDFGLIGIPMAIAGNTLANKSKRRVQQIRDRFTIPSPGEQLEPLHLDQWASDENRRFFNQLSALGREPTYGERGWLILTRIEHLTRAGDLNPDDRKSLMFIRDMIR